MILTLINGGGEEEEEERESDIRKQFLQQKIRGPVFGTRGVGIRNHFMKFKLLTFLVQKFIKNTKFGPTPLIFCTLKLDTFTFHLSHFPHFLLNLMQFYNNVKKKVGIWPPYPIFHFS